jgi:hypothetical protein
MRPALTLRNLNLLHLPLVVFVSNIVFGVCLRLESESLGKIIFKFLQPLILLLFVDFDPVQKSVDVAIFVALGDDLA